MASAPQTPTPATDRVANIFNLSRDTVRIMPKSGYDVTVMVGVEVEAYIAALDGSETVIAKLERAKPGEKVTVERYAGSGAVDVVYSKAKEV